MPWKCPQCELQIRNDAHGPSPRVVYRCYVCHLDLVLDVQAKKLTPAATMPEDAGGRLPNAQ